MAAVFRCRNQLTRYMKATGAVNSAKRRANNISSFFMADLPSLAMSRLPDQGKDIRDRHHVLEPLPLNQSISSSNSLIIHPRASVGALTLAISQY
jgi:hypothetical protein